MSTPLASTSPVRATGPLAMVLSLLVAAFVVFVMAVRHGPGLWADAEQARLCRMLIPALYPQEDGIRVTGSEAGSGKAVHVAFRMERNERHPHLLTCRFGGVGYSAAKRDLVSVQLDGVGLGEASFYFLKFGWLETQDAVAADPGAPVNDTPWLEVSRETAVALQHVINTLPRSGILALLALATALIYGLIGRINLAFGEFAAVGGVATTLAVLVTVAAGLPNPALDAAFALVAALALTALAGAVVGATILHPLSGGANMNHTRAENAGQQIIVAGVGLLVLVQEGLRLAQGSGTIWLPPVDPAPIILAAGEDFDVTAHLRLLVTAGLDWLAVFGVLIFMYRSRFGRAWRASADDPLAAGLFGIGDRRILIGTSALATGLAGLAGASITLNYGGMPFSGGTMLGLTALIAAILGGIGSLKGAVVGAAAIAIAQGVWSALQPIAEWEPVSFVALTLFLILRPEGFFGIAGAHDRKHP